MKTTLRIITAALFTGLIATPALASDAKQTPEKSAAQESQQNKMKTCNAEAKKKDLHGDERRAFMSSCLKG